MARPGLEMADVLNQHGDAYLHRHAGHLSLDQLKVISAIRSCRTAALGGHVARCSDCAHTVIAYNSCRNRHCPRCQGGAAKRWLTEREADLLPVPYFHVVFTLPAPVAAIAFANKAAVYDLLFKAAAETITTVAADPKHLGARVGLTAVLHTWGSALTHHPHVHMIVPGGGLSPDRTRWIACRPGFFLPVRVLSRLFRRLFLDGLMALHAAGRLAFFGEAVRLAERDAFAAHLAPLRKTEWPEPARGSGTRSVLDWQAEGVYAKRPFGGPEAVLANLSLYTHRVAISNSRLIGSDESGVTFRWKDYRTRGKVEGQDWIKTMRLEADEFIRRFLIHVLPGSFHRIRHYGLLASATRKANIARARELIAGTLPRPDRAGDGVRDQPEDGPRELRPCPCCGGRMLVIETFARGCTPRARPVFTVDSS